MTSNNGHLKKITQKLISLGPIKVRTQFGGYSLSVNRVVFAVVAEGELYLRACEASKPYLCERNLPTLKLYKRGVPVQLDYYLVDDVLWAEPEQLLAISRLCLHGAQQERICAKQVKHIRDLPNIGYQLERLLHQAGIGSIQVFREEGAKRSWLKLRDINQHLGINTLYALQGALSGFHYQALPPHIKAELRSWYEEVIRQFRLQKRRTS